ncbi:MAG: antibiotic ABC transporter ATP-binding protein [Flavobacteriales bacterium CG18_big_fil_WC_8_21_14_2_50_32_9]|nr:MAG: antibiotic ABC transporter ATP-binding protein [Flavobacteriales bacterium CG18_big_fil_WC_8_21_14_2_50_32_9]
MESVSGKAFDYSLLKRILKYITPYKVMFYSTAFLSILLASISVVRPILIQKAVNNNIANKDSLGLYEITIWLVVALIIETLLQYVFTYYGNLIGQNIIKDIRNEVFKRVLSFKLKYYDQTPIGRLVTRTVSDIETIAEMFSDGILVILGDLLKIFAAVLCMFYINWDLALITLLPIPLLMIGTSIFKRVIKNAFQDVRNQVSLLNTFVQEHVTGMSIVQIFNREKIESELFSDINKKHRDAHIKTVWAYSVFFPLVEILSALSVALLVWYGFKEISLEIASPGEIFSFTFFIHMLYRPIRQLADRFNSLQMGMVSSERVFKVLDTNYNIANEGTQTIENLNGDITFKNVWFAYNEEDWVLKDISFTIKKGQTLALVGATGAGKSSMINLLGRYYEINKGEIFIDNINVTDFELNHLRKSMAVVLQDVFLFSDTVFNNITLFSDEISEERVIEAAKKIGAHDFITKLPGGYQYNVKERGALLSVGQRQLISFIRAYVHNPRILILDEATSSIDSESEALIKHATEILTQNTTSIIVAHRLSTIQNADKILVIDKGCVVEEGTHQELLKLNGHYKKLYNYQFEEVI